MTPSPKTGRISFLLVALALIGAFPLDVLLPSFPALSAHFARPLEQLSLTLSVFAAGMAIAQLVIGPLSDVFGRRRLLVGGLLVAAVGAVGAAQTQSFTAFITFRFVQALGCGCFVLANAIIQDVYTGQARNRIRIVLMTSSGVFISLAPLAGVLLQSTLGWTAGFWLFAGVASVTAFLCRILLAPPTRIAGASQPSLYVTWTSMLSDRRFTGSCALVAIGFSSHLSFIVLSPVLFLEEMNFNAFQYGSVLLCYGVAYIAGGAVAIWLNARVSAWTQLTVGLTAIGTAGVLLVSLPHTSAVPLVACMILCSLGVTLVRPTATGLALEHFPAHAGAASALLNTSMFLSAALISGLLTWLPFATVTKLGMTMLLLSAAALAVLGRVTER